MINLGLLTTKKSPKIVVANLPKVMVESLNVVVGVLAYLIKLFWGVQGRNCACTFRYCSPTISLFFLLYLCFNSQHCSTWLFQSNISQPSILEELENSFCALIFLKQIDFFFSWNQLAIRGFREGIVHAHSDTAPKLFSFFQIWIYFLWSNELYYFDNSWQYLLMY